MKKSFRTLVYTIHQWPPTERNLQVFFVGFFFLITQVVHKWNHHMHEDRPIT